MDEDHAGPPLRRRTLVLAALAIVAVVALLLATSFGNLLNTELEEPPEGAHETRPPTALGNRSLDGGRAAVVRLDGNETTWPYAGGALTDGVFRMAWSNGSDTLNLSFRLDQGVPVRLAPDVGLARTNTFDVDLTSASANVTGHLDVLTWDPLSGRVSGDGVFTLSTNASVLDVQIMFPKPHGSGGATTIVVAVVLAVLFAAGIVWVNRKR